MPQFQNAQALIIGGSGGIGLAIVQQLLTDARFERVYATYRDRDRAMALLNLAATEPKLTCLPCDPTAEAQIIATVEKIQQQTDRLHLVLNCVGTLHDRDRQPPLSPEKSLRHIDREQLLHYFDINAIPSVVWAKHAQILLKHPDNSVFATISAKVGSIEDNHLGGWYGYRASKAALNMFLKTIAIEFSRTRQNAIVVALHPGTTDTALSQPFQGNVPPGKLFTPQYTAACLLRVIDQLTPQDNGAFFAWNGDQLPW